MTLWRIHLKPASKTGFDSRKYCIDNNIVGFGWPIPAAKSSLTSSEYEEQAKGLYLANNDKSWYHAWNSLYNRMEIGDLIWTRTSNGYYYLGRVESEWQYDFSEEAVNADIANIRNCKWFKVGIVDSVPGKVVSSFIPSRTLQMVHGDGISDYSQRIYNQLSGTTHYSPGLTGGQEIFSFLSWDACEDLVGLYLQLTKEYLLLPSSCKIDTLAYEYVLIKRATGEKAVVQVKTGDTGINKDDYKDINCKIYLFAVNGSYSGDNYSHVEVISRVDFEAFLFTNKELLPDKIKLWINTVSPLPQLPRYLFNNKDRIFNKQDQQIQPLSANYDAFSVSFPVVKTVLNFTKDRSLQRRHVLDLFKIDLYTGFISSMMWGGINSTRPKTKNGTDTQFRRLLEHPRTKVQDAINHANELIAKGSYSELFLSFAPGGDHKLPGVGYRFYTKLFYFLGELQDVKVKPLIFDKWSSNSHCALLIQSLNEDRGLPYLGISATEKHMVELPKRSRDRAALYSQFVVDFNNWTDALNNIADKSQITPGLLEEFVFGQRLNEDPLPTNPRRELWSIIVTYFRKHHPDISMVAVPANFVTQENEAVNNQVIPELDPDHKYYPLQEYLRENKKIENDLVVDIVWIEKLLGFPLNDTCFENPAAFWGNSGWKSNRQKRAWLSQGFRVARPYTIFRDSRTGSIIFQNVNS